VTPTATIVAGGTVLRLDYENFHDDRTSIAASRPSAAFPLPRPSPRSSAIRP
jgi:hypothetical protein